MNNVRNDCICHHIGNPYCNWCQFTHCSCIPIITTKLSNKSTENNVDAK